MDMKRLKKQMDFILEIDKEKNIKRQTLITDASRQETDAEHAWHLAVMCALLSEYSNEKIDVAHTMLMVLMHDLVEIDAGDTYAYDEEANKSKEERELKAADRIYNLLPPDQAKMARELWDEFEAMETPESKFANTLDKIQPAILNDAAGGVSWTSHTVYIDQILKRDARVHEGSEVLWEYTKNTGVCCGSHPAAPGRNPGLHSFSHNVPEEYPDRDSGSESATLPVYTFLCDRFLSRRRGLP